MHNSCLRLKFSFCRWEGDRVPGIAAFLLGAVLLLAPDRSVSQSISPENFEEIGIDQRLGEQLPLDLVFNDENGRPVPLRSYFGEKPVILSLVYYECPMLCTQVLNGLLRSLKVLSLDIGKEFEVITVSFDPGEKSELAAAKKKEYLRSYGREGAGRGWHFLTGTDDQIDRLTRTLGFRYQYDPETDEYIHSSGIMVLTPQGKLARYFYGIEYAPKDLRLGLIESATDKIGSPIDQVLLLCYSYDPESGKYGLVIVNSIRIAGLATVAILAGFIVTMIRRERSKK